MIETSSREQSVDLLRGIVMIIMVLDHTRDFVHYGAQHFSPEDLSRTTAVLFLTRWITHFCAPVFMLTAGIGASFRARKPGISAFLLTRGLWLMFLEITVLRVAFYFGIGVGPLLLTILWALGLSMVVLSALVYLPARLLAVIGVAIIAGHNLLDGVRGGPFWNIVHQPGLVLTHPILVIVAYPLIPWVAVMATGYCLGELYLLEEVHRRQILLGIGSGLIAMFLAVRGINLYGDPFHWTHDTLPLSFLRCTKYPPSLDYLMMTLGPALLALACLGRVKVSRHNPVLIFGRVPLFFFLIHIVLIHLAAMALSVLRYGTAGFLFNAPPSMGTPAQLFPPDYGWSLGATYAVWLAIVIALYPLCRWFAGVKLRRHDWWLAYL